MDAPPTPPDTHPLERLLAHCAARACGPCNASEDAYLAAGLVLDAALTRSFEAMRQPACARLLGPVVRGATMARGARVPGTSYELDPVQAAFDIGVLTGWKGEGADEADEVCASACMGGILAVADYLSRNAAAEGRAPLVVRDLLDALIVTADLRGGKWLAMECRAAGLDPAFFVRFATTAVAAKLLGCDEAAIRSALTHAVLDGAAPHLHDAGDELGARHRWSAADANSRATRLALLVFAGEPRCALPPRFSSSHAGLAALLQRHPLTGPRAVAPSAIELELSAGTRQCAGRLEAAIAGHYPPSQAAKIVAMLRDRVALADLPVHDFVALLVRN